jgi:ribosome-associated protein
MDDAFEWRFFSAGGPGGQHVNKTASAAMLRVDVMALGLPDWVVEKLRGKMTQDGLIVIIARRYRSQEQNKEDALARWKLMLAKAHEREAVRRKTRPTRASGERRLSGKRVRSEIKGRRGKVSLSD